VESKKYSIVRRILAVILLLIGGATYAASFAEADATHQAVIGMPFTGKWAYNAYVSPPYTDVNSSYPSVHAKYYGDWATDLYAAAGTAVKFEVPYATGALSYSWVSVTDGSCGQRTVIAINVDGVAVGSVYYEHLSSAVKSGTISNGMVVGYVHDWGGCNPGPHVHIELKNSGNFSCYADNGSPGTTLNEGTSLGVLGSTNTGERQACSSIPSGGPVVVYQSFAGDFNGDGVVDFGLRNISTGTFYARYGPSYGVQTSFTWDNSISTYQSFMGDFNRDGVVDFGLRNPSTGTFYARYGPGFGDATQTAFTWDHG